MITNLLNRLEEIYPEMVELRRYLHQNPELSFEEVKTPIMIAEYLEELGVEVKRGVGGRGVVGMIRGGKPGKTIAIRADFDALPIQEENDVPYKSNVPGVMHACGHDAHTATLLGIAKVFMENREELHGNVVLIHQFAEEITPGGAKPMIEDGCLDGVDAIFGTHIWSTLPVGEVYHCTGPVMAASDAFEIEIIGKGGHGAVPHETIDAIAVASTFVSSLQQIVSRHVDPLKSAVISVGSFHAGNAFNVIADKVKLNGTVRTFDPAVQDAIIEKLERYLKGVCESAGATYRFDYRKGYPAVINHEKETVHLAKVAQTIVGDDRVKEMSPMMGGEDFAYYLQHVPGTFFFTGAGNEEEGITYPHHHPKFNLDEKSMLIAAKVLTKATYEYMKDGVSEDGKQIDAKMDVK